MQIVAAAGETVNTTSGEVSRVIDRQQVQNLALNGRNYIQLLSLVPGVALLNDDQLELTTSLATGNQSINGNRGQTNNVTVDGGFNLQSGSMPVRLIMWHRLHSGSKNSNFQLLCRIRSQLRGAGESCNAKWRP